jgi:3',5'-cyclic AMP phosphodiesterase CpdA
MKVAHISDLHLTTFFKNSSLRQIKFLLRYILSQNPDHIVITGDLTDNADENDFLILRNLFKNYGILHTDRLSLVIGNHDIFGGVQTAEDIFTFPENCANVDYRKRVKSFYEYYIEAFDKCLYLSKENIFPFVKILDNVLITGVNSIAGYSKIKNPFASNGEISAEQFSELADILEQFGSYSKTKIILIHHHFNKQKINKEKSQLNIWQSIEKQTMKLRKKKRLINFFKMNNIDLILHGHLHESKEYYRKGVRFLNAGATIKANKEDELSVNFINIKPDEITTEIHKIKSSSQRIVNKNYIVLGKKEKDNNIVPEFEEIQ